MLASPLRRLRGERGMVTVELAASIPVILLLLAFALTAIDAARARLACVDAARDGALAAARGSDADGQAAALRLVPGATVAVSRAGGFVTVTVTAVAPLAGALPDVTVSASSTAAVEPEAAPADGAANGSDDGAPP